MESFIEGKDQRTMASDGEAKLYTPSDKHVSEKREN